jgi:hypothetical protein
MHASRQPVTSVTPAIARREYMSPALEPLGSWRALTLQDITIEGYLEEGRDQRSTFA